MIVNRESESLHGLRLVGIFKVFVVSTNLGEEMFDEAAVTAPQEIPEWAERGGSQACTSVPRPGAERISKRPPTSTARSFIPSSPRLAPSRARRCEAATSKPAPSSRTMRCHSFPSSSRSSMVTFCAPAWRTILVIASWAMRKQVVAICAGGFAPPVLSMKSPENPARSACCRRYQRSAGTRPRSSSMGGRRSSDIRRTCSRAHP